jgi:hypothetical protein
MMPPRILVKYQFNPNEVLRPIAERRGEVVDVILMRSLSAIGYSLYMSTDRQDAETGMSERTLEFQEDF